MRKRPDYETWFWVVVIIALCLALAAIWGYAVEEVVK